MKKKMIRPQQRLIFEGNGQQIQMQFKNQTLTFTVNAKNSTFFTQLNSINVESLTNNAFMSVCDMFQYIRRESQTRNVLFIKDKKIQIKIFKQLNNVDKIQYIQLNTHIKSQKQQNFDLIQERSELSKQIEELRFQISSNNHIIGQLQQNINNNIIKTIQLKKNYEYQNQTYQEILFQLQFLKLKKRENQINKQPLLLISNSTSSKSQLQLFDHQKQMKFTSQTGASNCLLSSITQNFQEENSDTKQATCVNDYILNKNKNYQVYLQPEQQRRILNSWKQSPPKEKLDSLFSPEDKKIYKSHREKTSVNQMQTVKVKRTTSREINFKEHYKEQSESSNQQQWKFEIIKNKKFKCKKKLIYYIVQKIQDQGQMTHLYGKRTIQARGQTSFMIKIGDHKSCEFRAGIASSEQKFIYLECINRQIWLYNCGIKKKLNFQYDFNNTFIDVVVNLEKGVIQWRVANCNKNVIMQTISDDFINNTNIYPFIGLKQIHDTLSIL